MKNILGAAIILWYYNKSNDELLFGKNKKEEIVVLTMLRDGKNEPGTWSVPGGHVNDGEDPKIAVLRELLEETGINLFSLRDLVLPLGFCYDQYFDKNYITLWYSFKLSGKIEANIMEPEKCKQLIWHKEETIYKFNNKFSCLRNWLNQNGGNLWPKNHIER
ncbi:MAG: NUDIX hydrolase [Thioploca sp.]|nr:NUDIX hydrolase [Thioploca sp.]